MPAGQPAHSPLAGLRILIVEDTALVAGELVRVLRQAGCVVVGPCPSVPVALATQEHTMSAYDGSTSTELKAGIDRIADDAARLKDNLTDLAQDTADTARAGAAEAGGRLSRMMGAARQKSAQAVDSARGGISD